MAGRDSRGRARGLEQAMRIGFYGEMGERIGREVEHLPAPGATTVAGLRRSLASAYPHEAEALLSLRLKTFVADAQVDDDASLAGVGQVEFLPPLSGG